MTERKRYNHIKFFWRKEDGIHAEVITMLSYICVGFLHIDFYDQHYSMRTGDIVQKNIAQTPKVVLKPQVWSLPVKPG